ncbi:MAG: hypothetical protein IT200_15255 [Thermoleophilia bacterium]|nr:hypothetical protein [Thermoleophilia bacterium]
MDRDQLIALIASADPIAAARAAGVAPGGTVTFAHGPDPSQWLDDGDAEGPVESHRAAHAEGRPSVAAVAYGAGSGPETVADRLLSLAALAGETGMLRAVVPVPGEGTSARPGSWGVEDLVVIGAARAVLPGSVAVRPCWPRLGAPGAQVAAAFGATDWQIPDGEDEDPARLAGAVGRTAVPR